MIVEHKMSAYGLWYLVIINSAIFIAFAFSFTKPKTKLDWKSFGGFSAFIIALFVEMYGFPLTIYIFSGWLSANYPNIDFLTHESGHLLHTLLGIEGDPHYDPFHIASIVFIIIGFMMLASSWRVLYKAQKSKTLATTGLYAKIRHPQYVAFIIIMFGFLLQWPTLVTLIMFPVLVIMYVRLAKQEEKNIQVEFGKKYKHYLENTPAFIPKF